MAKKEYDIKDILVGVVVRQGEVQEELVDPFDPLSDINRKWGYKLVEGDKTPFKLFVKTLGGYRHILTDTIYKKSSHKTGWQIVINRRSLNEFTKEYPEIAQKLIKNNIKITYNVVEMMEKTINGINPVEKEEASEVSL